MGKSPAEQGKGFRRPRSRAYFGEIFYRRIEKGIWGKMRGILSILQKGMAALEQEQKTLRKNGLRGESN